VFISLIRTTASLLGFVLFMYMIRGFIEWVVLSSSLHQMILFSGNTESIIRRATHFINTVICGIVLLPAVLVIWGVYLGPRRINVGLVITAASILYVTFLASWVVQKLLMDVVLTKQRVETGVKVSIARLVHYVFIFIGFLAVLFALEFDITNFTIMVSALGVGIGFGLQNIVTNFISGLILLFERPVRVGDYIEVDGKWAKIKNIGLRATNVQTLDLADVIIPNADLVANRVVNWTLSNRRVRLIIQVGVAYGSDISLVIETLMSSANEISKVAKKPEPQVLFLSFGESSLDFELHVWVLNAEERLTVKSDLHQEIDRRFREADIEIALPQQGLHLRSVDESVILQHAEGKK